MSPTSSKLPAILAACLPIAYALVLPPFQAPDEHVHFARSAALSRGEITIISESKQIGYRLDCAAERLLALTPRDADVIPDAKFNWSAFWQANIIGQAANGECFYPIDVGSFPLHLPLIHLPQTAGIAIARIFTNQPAIWLYSGRLLNAAVSGLLLGLLLSRTFQNSRRLLFFATIPMVGHMLGSLTGDSMALVSAFALYALLSEALRSEQGTEPKWSLIFPVAVTLGIAKSVYIPLALLIFLIPLKTQKRRDWAIAGSAILLLFLVLASWNSWIGKQYLAAQEGKQLTANQIQHILEHPFKAAVALVGGYVAPIKIISVSFFGAFGWMRVFMPLPWYFLYFLLACFFIASEPEDRTSRVAQWAFPLAAAIGMFGISLSMYLIFTPVGYKYTLGIQGRYLIPLMPFLLFPIVQTKKFQPRLFWLRQNAMLIFTIFNLSALILVFKSYN
jgi:uncharacterized membrane protein